MIHRRPSFEGRGITSVLRVGLPTPHAARTVGLLDWSGDLRSEAPAGSGDPRRTRMMLRGDGFYR